MVVAPPLSRVVSHPFKIVAEALLRPFQPTRLFAGLDAARCCKHDEPASQKEWLLDIPIERWDSQGEATLAFGFWLKGDDQRIEPPISFICRRNWSEINGASAMNIKRPIVAILTLILVLAGHAFAVEGQNAASDQTRSDGPAGRAVAVGAPDKTAPTVHARDPRYVIRPSDTLELRFPITPDFNQTVTVQPDGYITLRDAGGLRAAGQTLPELTDSIKKAYSSILHNPVVSVDPKDFNKPSFIVAGQVGRPGKFDLRGDVTLTEAVAMAGGFTDAAKHSQVLLFRRVSDQWTEAKIINTKKMFSSHNLQEDPVLQPGDMLFVPKNALSKIKPFLPTTTAGAYYNPAATF